MRVIGLTGGIACGKSTVAAMLAERGAAVVDADQVAREVVEPGQPAYDDIVAAFGRQVLLPDGKIDRKKLGAIVFADAGARARLNAITHPRIGLATQARLGALAARGVEVAVYEAALLVENGIHRGLGGLIVVACDEATQLARLVHRDGLSRDEALARVRAQLPLRDKIAVADWVVDTTGTLDDVRGRVGDVWTSIRSGGKGGSHA